MINELYNEERVRELLKNRIRISDITDKDFNKNITVAGFIKSIRDVGKSLKFVVISDSSQEIQLTIKEGIYSGKVDIISKLTPHTFIVASGELVRGLSKKGREILVKELYLLGEIANPLPIDIYNVNTSLDKRLDYRWLDLRVQERRVPLLILSDMIKYWREFFYKNGFIEIFSPKLMGSPSEGGSEVFEIPYFDKKAYLAQSPQFYKQMAICAGFERVFEIGPVFRANPSFTTRHDTEFTSLDVEMGYITSHHEIMDWEEKMLQYVFKRIQEDWGKVIEDKFKQEISFPRNIPRIKMEDVYEIISKENIKEDGDIRPEGEREIFRYVKENYDSDFVFIVDYPYSARPFYHMKGEPMRDGRETTKSFDLIYKGIEITTGAQREHRYTKLVQQAKEKGLNLENLKYYLEFFKYGAPPMGGFGLSPTRVVMCLIGAKNIREVTFVPRDPNRLFP